MKGQPLQALIIPCAFNVSRPLHNHCLHGAHSWCGYQRTDREQCIKMVLGYLKRSHFDEYTALLNFLLSLVKFQAFPMVYLTQVISE